MDSVSATNPFAPPTAHVEDVTPGALKLAGRGARLGAMLIDAAAQSAVFYGLAFTVLPALRPDMSGAIPGVGTMAVSLASGLVMYLLLNGYLIHTQGQTIGKKLVGLRMVRSNGERASFARLVGLRYALGLVFMLIPAIGWAYGLVDSLLIFRASRKCLHDTIADTIVITT